MYTHTRARAHTHTHTHPHTHTHTHTGPRCCRQGRELIQSELERAWKMLRGKGDLEAAFQRRNVTDASQEHHVRKNITGGGDVNERAETAQEHHVRKNITGGGNADERAETGGTGVALDTPRKRGAPGEGGDGRGVIIPAKRKRCRGKGGAG